MPGIKKFKMRNEDEFEESPLLAREHNSPMHDGGFGSDSADGNDRLHPERFDMTRFSERQDEEESSFRIVIYIVIVILIGIALAFAARFFITRQSDTDETPNPTETQEETNAAVTISTNPISDELAENAPANSDLVDSALVSIGSAEITSSNFEVTRFIYDRYETFARNIFTLRTTDGTESDFPRVNVEFNPTANTIKVIFAEDTIINEDLMELIGINDTVTEVTYSSADNSFLLVLAEESKYRVWTNNLDLIIDVRTLEDIENIENAPDQEVPPAAPVEEEPVVETPPATGGTLNLMNEFSRSKQSVTSLVSGNTIGHNEFFYGDTVEYFEFAWGSRNNVGNDFVPNSTAELVTEGSKSFIEVTINNLSSEAFEQYGISGTALTTGGINLSEANFVRIDRISFANGTAVYRIELKRPSDFRIISETTIGGATQVVSVQIKD